jgi:hypothetical protein
MPYSQFASLVSFGFSLKLAVPVELAAGVASLQIAFPYQLHRLSACIVGIP